MSGTTKANYNTVAGLYDIYFKNITPSGKHVLMQLY